MFVASAADPTADKKAREFPEILFEGLIGIIMREWVGVQKHWRIVRGFARDCHGVPTMTLREEERGLEPRDARSSESRVEDNQWYSARDEG